MVEIKQELKEKEGDGVAVDMDSVVSWCGREWVRGSRHGDVVVRLQLWLWLEW